VLERGIDMRWRFSSSTSAYAQVRITVRPVDWNRAID
jgi:hypothetical protein